MNLQKTINACTVVVCLIILVTSLGAVKSVIRQTAQEAICMTQLSQLYGAWSQFAEDHDGALVSSETNLNVDKQAWVWHSFEPNLFEKLDGITQGALFPYVGSVTPYHCPSDLRLNDPNRVTFRSYSIPHGLNGYPISSWGITVRTLTGLKNPSQRYVFLEEPDPRPVNLGSWVMYDDHLDKNQKPFRWADPVASWHREGMNLVYADGHVMRRPWVNPTTIEIGNTAHHDRNAFFFGRFIPENEEEDYLFMLKGYVQVEDPN